MKLHIALCALPLGCYGLSHIRPDDPRIVDFATLNSAGAPVAHDLLAFILSSRIGRCANHVRVVTQPARGSVGIVVHAVGQMERSLTIDSVTVSSSPSRFDECVVAELETTHFVQASGNYDRLVRLYLHVD
jgi:hypothetical protein